MSIRSTRAITAGTLTTPRPAPTAQGGEATQGEEQQPATEEVSQAIQEAPVSMDEPPHVSRIALTVIAIILVIALAASVGTALFKSRTRPEIEPEPVQAEATEPSAPTEPEPTEPVIVIPEPGEGQELVWVSARWSELHGAQPGDVISIKTGNGSMIPELQYVLVRQVDNGSFELIMYPAQKEAFLRQAGMERKIALVAQGNAERTQELLKVQEGVLSPQVRIIMKDKLEAVYGKPAELLCSIQTIPAEAAMPNVQWFSDDEEVARFDEEGLHITGVGKTNLTVQCGDLIRSCEIVVEAPTDGWAQVAHGSRYFYQAGDPVTGWLKQPGDKRDNWYHFDKDGAMQTGWFSENDQRYYLDPNTGIMTVGDLQIGKKLYHFDSNGVLRSEQDA